MSCRSMRSDLRRVCASANAGSGNCSMRCPRRVFESSSVGVIAALGILLLIFFIIWVAANAIYIANFGYASPSSVETFLHDVFTTRSGWNLILVGNGVGLLFAILVLTISVVSFPLLLDRDVGAAVALLTSIRAVAPNPVTMMVWGLIVSALLVIGSLQLFSA